MPTYTYHCPGCGAWLDIILSINDPVEQTCTECGAPARRSFRSVRLSAFGKPAHSTSPVVDYFWESGNVEVFDAQKDVRRAQKTGVFEKTGKYSAEDLQVAKSYS